MREFWADLRTLSAGILATGLVAGCVAVTRDAPAAIAVEPAAQETVSTVLETGPGGRMPTGRVHGVRSAVVAPTAAAATAHPLATQIALDVMKDGGSAMDAAIAANAMLGLVEPTGNGIGGDLFAMGWDPATGQLYGYNGSGRAPMGATLADMQAASDEQNSGEGIPPFGAAPVSVPGTVDGWFALHEKFGRRPMSENLRPAIEYARNGAPIPEVIAYYWGFNEIRLKAAHENGMLEEYENARRTFFDPVPVEGTLFRNPDLADTLTKIALNGRAAFYEGSIARTIDAYFERIGGYLSYEDMAAHQGEWVEPICVTYRDAVKLCELGPNTQGVAALQMLQMLERFDLREMGFGSADSIMAQVEAKRLAFADRARGYADPAFSGIDPKLLLDRDTLEMKFEAININMAMDGLSAHIPSMSLLLPLLETACADDPMNYGVTWGDISAPPLDITCASEVAEEYLETNKKLEDGDTTYLSVADKDGMMVSLIQSNYRGMGTGLVADGLGFMFQDRGELFSLDPNHPNVFEPGKRPFHTIIPAFAFKKDMPGCQVRATAPELACPYEPWLSFGLMGGGMQPQGHVQIILNLVDFDMGLQEAGDAARWEHVGGCEPTDEIEGDACESDMGVVQLEGGIPVETARELERRGHSVRYVDANAGGYQAVMRDFDTGAWIAATEMRKDGTADGY